METATKPLTAFSIEEIEGSIAGAISALTNTKVKAEVTIINKLGFDEFVPYTTGNEKFKISVSLECGVSYTRGLEENEDGSFRF